VPYVDKVFCEKGVLGLIFRKGCAQTKRLCTEQKVVHRSRGCAQNKKLCTDQKDVHRPKW
jgi:hypothetical protein